MTESADAKSGEIKLAERLDMTQAQSLQAQVLETSGDLVLQADGVSVVTTPGLQVLMAIRDHQAVRERTVRIDAPSAGFLASLKTLGVPLSRLQTESAHS